MYRLSRPLQDVAPECRNVYVQLREDGERHIWRAAAYQDADGQWRPVPRGSWTACFSTRTARDLALIEAEIAACHGNWSA